MAEFVNQEHHCRFTLPDRPTVRQQLAYYAATRAARAGHDEYAVYWEGARALIQTWDCPALPDPAASLDELTNPEQALVVLWAGLMVRAHINGLENVPKNS